MLVAIVGSRDYADLDSVVRFVNKLARKYPNARVVSGGAKGVDTTAEFAAKAAGLNVVSLRPKDRGDGNFVTEMHAFDSGIQCPPRIVDGTVHSSFGRAAFYRNSLIVRDADHVVAFTNGSKGTQNSIDIARRNGTPVHINP